MAEFQNVKIVGIGSDVTRSLTGNQSDGSVYTNLNILDLDQISQSWSGGMKSSVTSISATINGATSAGAYALNSASGVTLTAAAFLTIKDENNTTWRIPLFN
jgi:hypothetical protein